MPRYAITDAGTGEALDAVYGEGYADAASLYARRKHGRSATAGRTAGRTGHPGTFQAYGPGPTGQPDAPTGRPYTVTPAP